MQSQVHEISSTEVEVSVEIPWEDVKKDLDASYRKLGQTARVKGFRKGKIPPKVLRQLFGKQVRIEVSGELIEKGLINAVTTHKLEIVAEPSVDGGEIQAGEPLQFKAKFEVRPKLEHVNLEGLEVARPSTEVKNEAVDAEVEKIREDHAEVRTPDPPRPAAAGDQLTIEYTVTLDGEEKPDMGSTDRQVILGNDSLHEAFENGLMGASSGDSRTVEMTFDGDDDREDLKGKTAVFSVTINEVQERVLPEVDDEFAKDAGDYETLLELRLKLRENLEAAAKARAEGELKERLIDKLVEINELEVPKAMVAQESQRMFMEIARLAQMGMSPGALGDDFASQVQVRAERKVRAAVLLGSLAREHDIQVAPGEIDKKITEIAEATGKHVAKVRAETQGERLEYLEQELLEQKILALLEEKATIREEEDADESDVSAPEPKQD
ncbi:MAG: trigger factor [Myxococcota bacterium]